jgi:hypothetical protein
MSHEYWGALSIFDYRRPIFRQALVTFDRLVLPVPTDVIVDLTEEEISRITEDAMLLARHDAAVPISWSPKEWECGVVGKLTTCIITNNPEQETRIGLTDYVADRLEEFAPGVTRTAIPVYCSHYSYEKMVQARLSEEMIVFEILMEDVLLPAEDVPLSAILKLRSRDKFRRAIAELRRWQTQIIKELVAASADNKLREVTIVKAAQDLKLWSQQYREEMKNERFKKVEVGILSLLGVGSALALGTGPLISTLAAIAPPLFRFRELFKPCWMHVASKQCAPAAIIYEASKLSQ